MSIENDALTIKHDDFIYETLLFYQTKMGPPLKPNDLENKVTFENTYFAVGPMFGRSRRLSVVPSHKFFLVGKKNNRNLVGNMNTGGSSYVFLTFGFTV